MRKTKLLILIIAGFMFGGCATVALESKDFSEKAKTFNLPPDGKAGLYIYRDNSIVGAALKKDIMIDGKCLGELVRGSFFYQVVEGNKEYKISTESEFFPNDLVLKLDSGKNYFIRNYIKMGVFVGGANLEVVQEEKAKQVILNLDMAKNGNCSKN